MNHKELFGNCKVRKIPNHIMIEMKLKHTRKALHSNNEVREKYANTFTLRRRSLLQSLASNT